MNIYIYINISGVLEKDFIQYSKLSNDVFNCSEAEFNLVFEQYSKQKSIIKKHLSQIKPEISFSENYYDENISDEETKMLLMNGIYDVEEVKSFLSKAYITNDFKKLLNEIIKSTMQNTKILFWNAE